MRIGVKISPLTVLKAGIPNYVLNLLKALAREDSGDEFLLYTCRALPMELDLPERFRVVRVAFPGTRLQLWYQIGLPLRMRRDRLDLFHDPVYPLPFLLPVPGVITVHDLSNYTEPHLHSLRASLAGKFLPHHIDKARMIIAVSSFTASHILDLFPRVRDKVSVVHQGVSDEFRRVEDAATLERVAGKYGLPSRFMLFLGTLEPRKNLEGLLRAFTLAGGDIPHSLVIAGGLGWKYAELLKSISGHPLRSRIHLAGFVMDEDLPALLSLAEFLVYPSLLEGFGLPILEAMACGTPVITSSTSAMPETAGDAAILVDPLSAESISAGLLSLGTDGELREDLIKRGAARASLFSWDRTAAETLKVYRKAAD